MRDANTIMLLLKSLKLAILFRFKLLNTSSNSSKFSSSNYIFVIMRCQKLMKCLFSVGDFFANFGPIEAKKLLNSLAMSIDFVHCKYNNLRDTKK